MLDAFTSAELSISRADLLESRIHELSCEPDFAQHPDFTPAMAALAEESPIRAEMMREWLELPKGFLS